jgi:hypothetical protein
LSHWLRAKSRVLLFIPFFAFCTSLSNFIVRFCNFAGVWEKNNPFSVLMFLTQNESWNEVCFRRSLRTFRRFKVDSEWHQAKAMPKFRAQVIYIHLLYINVVFICIYIHIWLLKSIELCTYL